MPESNYVGYDVTDLSTPSFLVDIDRVKNNANKMTDRCRNLGVKLRPHMKTHKTLEAGELMTNGTKRRIVVSTLREAEFFADGGFDDILLGVITTADKLKRCTELAKRLEAFHLLVDSKYAVNMLENSPLGGGKKWSVVMKVDTGYGRAGVLWDSEASVALGKEISSSNNLNLFGLYTHCGNSYTSRSPEELRQLEETHTERLVHLRERLRTVGVTDIEISCGSTPSCSRPADKFSALTELHPGNYVFYDWMQVNVGSCSLDDIAVRVVARVIGHYPEKRHMLIDAGFTALGSGGLAVTSPPPNGFTFIQGSPDLKITGMTQEVGYVKAVSGEIDYGKYPINSLLYIYPYHSCETASLFPQYYVHSGNKITAVWKPTRGW